MFVSCGYFTSNHKRYAPPELERLRRGMFLDGTIVS